ncbi:alpha-amylase [Clostridia bacterium]|nr:alpha-amylase [Clostridia bacterium]
MRKLLAAILALLVLSGCTTGETSVSPSPSVSPAVSDVESPPPSYERPSGNGRTWYQIFVYSFYDSDGDGIGDLNGVKQKIPYIKDMGFDGIWLSPIHPSTTYHKYDVKDYYAIDPRYGTMEDFDALLEYCRGEGVDVLLDLVLNHTSDEHPWFKQHPEYYHIQNERGNGSWYKYSGGGYYEAQFWDKMPDLNLANEALRGEFRGIVKFWLDKGVRGFRLDAVKEFESGNTAVNVEILTWLNNMAREMKPDVYFVGEDWDTTTGLYDYYASGIDSFFAFPFAGADGYTAKTLLRASGTAADYLKKVAEAQDYIKASNAEATAANFFTNHDNPRAAGFLRRDPNLIKTAWGMTLTQPGDAFVYYGEEIGMTGSGKDENKRAPMYWTDEPGAVGMTAGPPNMDAFEQIFPPLSEQITDENSIFSYVRDAVRLRAKYPQIARGTIEPMVGTSENTKIGAAARTWLDETIMIVYNLSGSTESLAPYGDAAVADYLSATGEKPELSGGTLQLPPYSIVILK